MKKLLLFGCGGVIALCVLAVSALLMAGAAQPVDHVASVRATFAAPAEEVWTTLTDFENYPDWNSMFHTVRRLDDVDGKPCWMYEGDWGPMPTVIDELQPPVRMVTRIAPDADIGFEGTWTYELASVDGGCTLTLTEAGSVTSVLLRGMGVLLFDNHDAMVGFLHDLGHEFGQEVEAQIVAVPEPG